VYLARPLSGESPAPKLVVKRLLPSLREDKAARDMFADEAELHRHLRHTNIVACYGAGEVEGEPYLAMELVQGADLHRILRLGQARKRPMPHPIATYITREILAALDAVHSAKDDEGHPLSIIHRDVSPSNIYLSVEGDVKLGDFGIARAMGSKTPRPGSLGTAIRGKFAYLSPEQIASEPVDHRADLFALANILSEMMLGRPLFPGSGQLAVLLAIRDVRIAVLDEPHGIPAPLVAVLKRALSRAPDARFPDAKSFAEALKPFSWQYKVQAKREVTLLVRWARDTSMEMRAVGEHPDQGVPVMSGAPPTSPDSRQATPVHGVPEVPRPALLLDSDLLESSDSHRPQPLPAADRPTAEYSPFPSHVKTSDGNLLGPFTYAKLVELVATGRVGGEDFVDFMGTGFVPLVEVDELSRHIAPRSSATKQIQGPGTPDWQGHAAARYDADIGGAIDPGIAEALGWVASRRETGVLLAQCGARRKEIYFVSGKLQHVASSEAGELIGEYLVTRGLLERSDLDFALAVLPRFNGHLGEALTGLGLIEPVRMFQAIQEQGRDKVVDVFTWDDGDLSFYSGATPNKVEFPLELAIGPVVEAGVAAMLDDRMATARYAPWLERKIVASDCPPPLREGGWSQRVERTLALAAEPIVVRNLLRRLAFDGVGPQDAVRAVESARVVNMLVWK